MFDIGAIEILVIAVVAIIVIGPSDMPQAMRIAGRWVGKIRRASAQFRSGFDAMVREAEMEDMEKTWKENNAKIMANSAAAEDAQMEPLPHVRASAEARDDASSDSDALLSAQPIDPAKEQPS